MDGRAFLDAARELVQGADEAYWRSGASRAYYALLHEGRAALTRWGFPMPPKEDLHRFVRFRFTFPADPDLRRVGDAVERLGILRNQADYRLSSPGPFASAARAIDGVQRAEQAIALLDQLDADPARRSAAIAAIHKAFPP
jgi:hypothetical protein